MAKKKETPQVEVKVEIIESERGWGQRVDEVKVFKGKTRGLALDKAEKFIEKFNAQNTATEVPDWYMYARLA